MGHLDELIKRAIETKAVPIDELQQFAEGVGKTELFQELTGVVEEIPEVPPEG